VNILILNFNQEHTDFNVYMERINTSQVDEFGFDIDTTFSFNQFKENLYSSQQRLNGYDKKLDYLLELDEEIKLFGIPIPKTEE
jgi:hypothetical protein